MAGIKYHFSYAKYIYSQDWMVGMCWTHDFLYMLYGVYPFFIFEAAFQYFSINSWAQCSVQQGRVAFLPMWMKRLQKKMANSSAEMGNLLYFTTNLEKALFPLKRSATSSTPQASIASCLQPLLPILVKGLKVSGQISTLTFLNSFKPQHQLTSAFGSGGICTLQSKKISEADFDSSSMVERKQTSSLLRYLQHLGMMSLTFWICSLSASPSMGINMAQTYLFQKSKETLVMSTKKPFWQNPLKMVWKPFWKLGLYFLSLCNILSKARVLKKCSLTPLWRGYLSTRSIFTIGSMLKMWYLKMSLFVGRLKNPLFTTYQRATSAVTLVVTNIGRPQKLAVVQEFLRRQAKCSARFSLMGLRNSICPSLTKYQMTAKQRWMLPSCFPPDIR